MPSSLEPEVSVVVPAHNAAATLARTLETLASQDLAEPYEVVVVDDGSTDDTAAIATAARLPVTLVRERGRGAAAARNAGARAATAPVLAFTDSDCFPTRGWLAAGLARIRDGAELVQGAIHPAPDDRGGPFARRFWVTRDVGLHETANLFVTRRAFHAAGGFERVVDDRDGRPMGEDTWFGWRVRRAGAPYEFAPDLVVEHEVFDRGGREYVRERRRDGHFAELAARMPELRGTLFFGRFFLSRRSAAFDAAVLGAATAALRRSPWPLALGLPYAVLLWRIVAGAGTAGPRLAAIHLAGDATGFGSLVRGSLRARSPVL